MIEQGKLKIKISNLPKNWMIMTDNLFFHRIIEIQFQWSYEQSELYNSIKVVLFSRTFVLCFLFILLKNSSGFVSDFLLMMFTGMILEGAFSLGEWITAPSMFCLSKKSTHTTSKWRMNAALATMRPVSSSCPIWPVTSWTKCLVSYVTHSCAFMIGTHWSTEHFSSRPDNITGLAFK